MSDPINSPPTLAGFINFARQVMGITTIVMPDDNVGWNYAYTLAEAWVPDQINIASPDLYTVCIYNFAGSILLQYQQDIVGQTFFADTRKSFNINSFVAGVISTAADNSTSESLSVGKGLQNLQIGDLQRLKDPYGRQALAIMQSIGTLWGLT